MNPTVTSSHMARAAQPQGVIRQIAICLMICVCGGAMVDARSVCAAETTAAPQWVALHLPKFEMSDARGKVFVNKDFSDASALVVAFLGVECPLAKIYGVRLQEIADQYAAQGVRVMAVNANAQDSITELAAYAKQHQLRYPVLKDVGNRFADAVKAERTPEIFVFDGKGQLQYRGRVDDQYGIGYVRETPQQHDLKRALDELLAGKPVSQPRTSAPGCIIGRVREPQADAEVTYENTIRDLLTRRCIECHQSGDIGPFALTDFDEVSGWAEMIGEVVADRRMPPWHATDNGVALADDRRLSQLELEQVASWVAAGAPRGEVTSPPAVTQRPATAGWNLPRDPDVVIKFADKPFKVAAEGALRYEYFSVPTNLKEDKWIEAFEVRPGNRAVVHHILIFAVPPGASPEEFGGGVRGFLASYVPGLRPIPYPKGMAKLLPAGSQLVFQMHYTPIGTEQEDLSEIGLVFADPADVEYEVLTLSAFQPNLEIPPHSANHT
ncbi:MAG: redoxin domain-containing protein, partial [Planctomycetales bacterium]|nr:redoxin domain-containing protein [Planctomycetales bacterium]